MTGLDRLKAYQIWGDLWARSGWRVQQNVATGECRVLDATGAVRLVDRREECLAYAGRIAPAWNSRNGLILLPALATTPRLLTPLAQRLRDEGHAVVNVAYPTLMEPMEGHVRRVEAIAAAMARDGIERISFVGHSMGGLVARCVVPTLPVPLGRMVFLGTSNQGSRLGQILDRFALYTTVFGPSGQDVLPEAAARMPVPDAPMLVVAGGTGSFGFNPLLRGDDDGIVRVEETRLPVPHEFLRIACLHRYLPRDPRAMRAVSEFLKVVKQP